MLLTFIRIFISVALGLNVAFAGVPWVRAASVSLDPTFGSGGIVTTDIRGNDDLGLAVELQTGGKIIVAGTSLNMDGNNYDFALARYNGDGSLDTTFDGDGRASTDIGNGNYDSASGIAVQPDGRIILAGTANDGNQYEIALARFHPDGSLDSTFDMDGTVTTPVGSVDDYGLDVALQPDGKILVVGFSFNDASSGDNLVLVRFNDNGSLDDAFGSHGIVITGFGCAASGHAVALQPDGKILVGGDACGVDFRDFALSRFNSDGSPDSSFDGDGLVTTDFGNSHDSAAALALQPDGRIVIAGHSYTDPNINIVFALARYNSDGSPDMTFDEDGQVTTDLGGWRDSGHALVIQPDGRLLVAGEQWQVGGTVDFALARYNPDGSLDMDFDTDGIVITDFSRGDYASGLALQPDGRIIVAGFSDNGFNFDFVLARYVADISTLEVILDVRPGKFPNRIELEKNVCKDDDNLPVAMLTTPEFDAQSTDAGTLQIGDPSLGGIVTPAESRARDVDGDGDKDLWMLFSLCDLVTNRALDENSTEIVLTGATVDGVGFTARDSVEIIRKGPRIKPVPVFIYPVDGQTLDFEGSYLFKVKPIPAAEGFLWGFFQDGVMVWENLRDEGVLSGEEYGIHPDTLAHSRFVPGPVEVWVRAWINGRWTDAAVITIHLRPVGVPLNPRFGTGDLSVSPRLLPSREHLSVR